MNAALWFAVTVVCAAAASYISGFVGEAVRGWKEGRAQALRAREQVRSAQRVTDFPLYRAQSRYDRAVARLDALRRSTVEAQCEVSAAVLQLQAARDAVNTVETRDGEKSQGGST